MTEVKDRGIEDFIQARTCERGYHLSLRFWISSLVRCFCCSLPSLMRCSEVVPQTGCQRPVRIGCMFVVALSLISGKRWGVLKCSEPLRPRVAEPARFTTCPEVVWLCARRASGQEELPMLPFRIRTNALNARCQAFLTAGSGARRW